MTAHRRANGQETDCEDHEETGESRQETGQAGEAKSSLTDEAERHERCDYRVFAQAPERNASGHSIGLRHLIAIRSGVPHQAH